MSASPFRFGSYLDPASVCGHRWVLRDAPEIGQALTKVIDPGESVDPACAAADIVDLGDLLRTAHIRFADADRPALEAQLDHLIADHSERALSCHSITAAEAFLPVMEDVRQLLRDGHLKCRIDAVAHVSPIPASDPRNAPADIDQVDDATLAVTVRRLYGSESDMAFLQRLADWTPAENCHHVVFDLRGCLGGDDSWSSRWIERHIDHAINLGESTCFAGRQRAVDEWNFTVFASRVLKLDVPREYYRALRRGERIEDALRRLPREPIIVDPSTLEPTANRSTWSPGRVSVLVDGGTCSSGESTAIMLREAFGARLIGQSTMGCVDYGNVTRYPMRRTGVVWQVPTHRNRWPGGDVDIVGVPVDIRLDDDRCQASVADLLPTLA